MKYFISGGAGFIGSNFCDRLLDLGNEVTVYDNLSTGRLKFLDKSLNKDKFSFIQGDILDLEHLKSSLSNHDIIVHFSANADVRFGIEDTYKDLNQNLIGTYNILESMRFSKINKIIFSSTGSVYGESSQIPTSEDAPFPIQTSLYGSSKLGAEGLISAYCEAFNIQSWIFRFVSILGERYSHGHVFDFYKKLQNNNGELEILGNGRQKKSYLYVQDCIDAILIALEKANEKINIYNLGTNEYCEVNDSVNWITKNLNFNPVLKYTGGDRGWVGDNPMIFLKTDKIRKLGWAPKYTIEQSIIKTLNYLKENHWLFENINE